MDLLHTIILTVHIIAGLSVIGLVLLQHGKGADMGAAFGSGSSGRAGGGSGATSAAAPAWELPSSSMSPSRSSPLSLKIRNGSRSNSSPSR